MRLRPVRVLVLVVAAAAGLAGCADPAADPRSDSAEPTGPTPADLVERARALSGVDEVSLVYVDPEGTEHDTPPEDASDRAGWVARIGIVHEIELGAGWVAETVTELRPEEVAGARPAVEIWSYPDAVAEVAALAYPLAADGADPVREAFLMASIPGVVSAAFDGRGADVQVGDESDLAKAGDVAAVHGLAVDTVSTADGTATLAVADVAPRPEPITVPLPWPDDPAAPDCAPGQLFPAIAGHDAATGHRAMMVTATNVGAEPCAVEGYPELAFRAIDERALDVTVAPGPSFMAQDPGATRVVVPPGARVVAVVGWNAMPTAEYPEGSGNRPASTAEVLLSPTAGGEPAELPLASHHLTPEQAQATDLAGSWDPITTLDIVDGGVVEVTAWAPEGTSP
ncbi:DUF4232 domain-containing protein [Jiangella asiatica]|uniref:DUF4232 domain-containing protein n=1 Tax=Jiangella asiatica TaxID=2530372 RepID=A0A4R5CZJ5_9ACTN|nr:DUF4232 domain-containing protein [Jiangella asiatica]TDE03385.1 DUF4232 domain-containing protein [Jiangella asiatica]